MDSKNTLSAQPGIKRRIGSLQGRYLIAAAMLSLVVLAMCISSLGYLDQSSKESRAQLLTRNKMEHITRQLYKNAWDAEYHLLNFTLIPDKRHQDDFHDTVDKTLILISKLDKIATTGLTRARPILERMHDNVVQLKKASLNFIEIRQNSDKLFPAMKIMVGTMSKTNNSFYQSATMVIDDLDFSPDDNSYQYINLFRDVRRNWTLMIGSFRVYVANRLGTFGNPEQGLLTQSQNVEMHHIAVQEQLAEIQQISNNQDIGLVGHEMLTQMKHDIKTWFAAYQRVKSILSSDSWRLDIPMLRNTIRPLFNNTRESLLQLSKLLEDSAALNIETVASTARKISLYQIITSLIMLFGIAIGYLYLRISVIKPVKELSAALLSAGKGRSTFRLSTPQTSETRTLVNAFNHMHSEINKRQRALQHQATHDTLTGLANRFLLHSTIDTHLTHSIKTNSPLALLMIDLDRFKEINDSLGHDAGDKVLLCIAERIQKHLRESDLAVRLGGDEFAILLPDTHLKQATKVARKIRQLLGQEMLINNQPLYVGSSIGIALTPEHTQLREMLINYADVAMYKAKRSRSDIEIFSTKFMADNNSQLSMSSDLHKAIKDNGLTLSYQPKIKLSDNTVCCIEALLRWNHPKKGPVPPNEIISMAEKNGQIRQLTAWVLNYALATHHKLLQDYPDLVLAINLSAWDLTDPGLAENVLHLLTIHNVPANRIALEVTESAMMQEPEVAGANLETLHKAGVQTAIDDFGTGFASLAYLKHLPLDELKLDKTFITDMTSSNSDAIIVESTIDLAHKLGMQVTAEGVESQPALTQLIQMGCDQVQGYHISQPLDIHALRDWLAEHDSKDMPSYGNSASV
ncbi:MAG TPA: EAL domain-containing protein [Gammaproteobacteria bacterium]|nr:EAL domain-containing protein [Gammaproteobacteria bacterium]